MRAEQEMFALIMDTARADERIRAVVLNGSRTNPNAPRDMFQDFDIVYLVTDVASFLENPRWLERFGEIMIVQTPDAMGDAPPRDQFAYLMQFTDGNRIDLTLYPVAKLATFGTDSLSVLLLDKDGIVAPFPPPDERDYFPKSPTPKQYADCGNEFWWLCPYVAKGLWRKEIPYAHSVMEQLLRVELFRMLTWHIGIRTGFAKNPGKFAKYFQKYLAPPQWALLLQTYADADPENIWRALFTMGEVFRATALDVAAHFAFAYPRDEDARVTAYLERVRHLAADAQEIV